MTLAPAHGLMVARTTALADPGHLLDLLPGHGGLSWVRRGEGMVAWGEAARFDTRGTGRFTRTQEAWRALTRRAVVRDEVGLPGCGPVAFGSFAFSPDSPAGGVLVVPRQVVGHRDGQWWSTTISLDGTLPPVPTPRHGLHLLDDDRRPAEEVTADPGEVRFTDGALDAPAWQDAVAGALTRIAAGDVEKVVLARDVLATLQRPLDVRWLLKRLAAAYPDCWSFSVDGLLGATPEMLVRLDKGLVASRVLAGTIRRSGDDERDLALAASLARSSKDLEEHEYAVRSVADVLARHCTTTTHADAPYVLHLANVMHLATDVTGVLRDGTSSLGLAEALHPSAAVCGTPADAAARLIDEVEHMDRDRYAGPVGWMDAGGDGEWGIALRCARTDPADARRLRLFAGCGIVAGSDPAAELAESSAKLLPVQNALTGP